MKERIQEFAWHIVSDDAKKHVIGTFNIEKEYKSLDFTCSYSPKYLFDEEKSLVLMKEAIQRDGYSLEKYPDSELKKHIPLANLVSWSIDSPEGFLGTKHKHNPNLVLSISKDKSTFGFKNSEIIQGQWRIIASLVSVVTDDVDLNVCVEGELEDEMD